MALPWIAREPRPRQRVIEFHPQARAVHIGAVLCSGTLFALRGAGVLAGARWPMAAALRTLSYAIDTVLLTAALVLVAMLPSALFANHWLTLKLVLLLAYVALGSLALKRGRGGRVRAICFVAALAVFAAMVGIARTHQPLGWLAGAVDAHKHNTRPNEECLRTPAAAACAASAVFGLARRPRVSTSARGRPARCSPPARCGRRRVRR